MQLLITPFLGNFTTSPGYHNPSILVIAPWGSLHTRNCISLYIWEGAGPGLCRVTGVREHETPFLEWLQILLLWAGPRAPIRYIKPWLAGLQESVGQFRACIRESKQLMRSYSHVTTGHDLAQCSCLGWNTARIPGKAPHTSRRSAIGCSGDLSRLRWNPV